ncbi:MAG: hypothetical protein GWN18_20150, partial [Thermoplasmata archaeon]|nr:hypothetical protein [Thermoplasmata archaeon]NIT80165.1 hypothetical protein [Thermoplasmata archaeon]NIU51293.1 hypothetical protein [Thermoplasmata archaeon]NIV81005.1 hypothetical protein [Thermoplasmata archaeon]NIW84817.1 hypothetical protein [Thermoplasmata archaeon]
VTPPNNNIDDVSIVDGVVTTIVRPQDGSALLATMNFPVLADTSELHLDLKWTETEAANPITPPYSGLIDWLVAYDGTTKITVTDNGDGTVNIPAGSEGNDIVFGIPYTFSVTPTRVFVRDRDGRVADMDRLSLNYFEVWCQGTELKSSVAAGKGRGPYTGTWDLTDEEYDEMVKIPVMADAEDAVLTITDTTPWALAISRFGWEGRYFPRTRRAR